jgi:hypothetical protein
VSWANLVAVLAAGRVALLTAVSYIFHFKFLQELAKSAESLSLSEIFELYRLKIIGFVVPGLSLNALAGALLLVMLIVSLRDTKQWRRLNVRKIY